MIGAMVIGGDKFSGKPGDWADVKRDIVSSIETAGYSYIKMGTYLFSVAGGFVGKCEEAKHSPPRRAAEDAPVTAQHDVPRWARGRWRPAAVRLRGWAVAAAPGRIFTFTG
jgi:hypothetical protein